MEKFELTNVVVPARLVKMVMEYLDKQPHGDVKIISGAMSEAIQNTTTFNIAKKEEKSEIEAADD